MLNYVRSIWQLEDKARVIAILALSLLTLVLGLYDAHAMDRDHTMNMNMSSM